MTVGIWELREKEGLKVVMKTRGMDAPSRSEGRSHRAAKVTLTWTRLDSGDDAPYTRAKTITSNRHES